MISNHLYLFTYLTIHFKFINKIILFIFVNQFTLIDITLVTPRYTTYKF